MKKGIGDIVGGKVLELQTDKALQKGKELGEKIGEIKGICETAQEFGGSKVQFLIPEGFAHGFLVLSDEAEFCYKVNDFYHPNDEGGMAWNDPEIGIEWPELKGEYQGSASAEGYTLADGTALILSDKDQKWMGLKDTFKF